jgi:hypothetical protein
MMQLRDDYAAHYAEQLMALEAAIIEKWKTKYGVRVQPLTAEDAQLSKEAGLKAQEYFLVKQEADGHPARKVWDYYTQRREFYEKQVQEKGYPWSKK